ncbi:MAG: hypothetical protein V4591_10420, partial [Bdellovibrionota bacterium]
MKTFSFLNLFILFTFSGSALASRGGAGAVGLEMKAFLPQKSTRGTKEYRRPRAEFELNSLFVF